MTELNIYQKLAKMRKLVEVIKRNRAGYGYRYVTEDEILAKITAGLEKYNIDYFPSIKPGTTCITPVHYEKTKITKDGNRYEEQVNEVVVNSELEYTWINLDNPDERIVVPWIIVGQQNDASQAFGSGLTYCNRYFLLKYFKVSTSDDDPDAWRAKQAKAAAEERVAIARQITEEVDRIIQSNVTEGNRDKLMTLVKSIVKIGGKASGNYLKIESPEMASTLLEAVNSFFNINNSTKKGEI